MRADVSRPNERAGVISKSPRDQNQAENALWFILGTTGWHGQGSSLLPVFCQVQGERNNYIRDANA